MRTILLTVSDDEAAALLRRHGGEDIDAAVAEALRRPKLPQPVRIDLRADPYPDGVVRVRETVR